MALPPFSFSFLQFIWLLVFSLLVYFSVVILAVECAYAFMTIHQLFCHDHLFFPRLNHSPESTRFLHRPYYVLPK